MDRIRVRLLASTPQGSLLIAAAARVSLSRKSVDDLLSMDRGEVARWVWELIRRSHGSPLEHASYTFLVEGCSRVCSHQLVRHRLASYTQQSMRYTDGYLRNAALLASRRLGLECPASRKEPGALECYSRALAGAAAAARGGEEWAVEAAREAYVFPPGMRVEDLPSYAASLLEAAAGYYALQARGVPMEEARYLLPQAARTRIVFTMNARELLESFIPLRTCSRAQAEIRLVAWLVLERLVEVEPAVFKYAGPRCVLEENRVRGDPRPLGDFLEGRANFTIARCPELVPREGIRACLRYAASTLRAAGASGGGLLVGEGRVTRGQAPGEAGGGPG